MQDLDLYTSYLERLGMNGEPPDAESYDEICKQLAKDLRREIARRGLLHSSPTFFGVAGDRWGTMELDELARDLYPKIFIRRLRGLRNQAKHKDNIRGLVIRNIKNFLTDRQMKADPIGYRVFDRVRKAAEYAIERGDLRCTDQGQGVEPDLSNDSILTFGEDTESLASEELLVEHAIQWNNELLPKLVTALGKAVPIVVERLVDLMLTLEDAGIRAFRLGDLIDAVKKDVRRRWYEAVYPDPSELGYEGDDENAVQVPIVDPRLVADAEDFAALVDCVKQSIGGLNEKARLKRELDTLFTFIRDFSENGTKDKRPSNVNIGKLLGISRERVPKLLTRLGDLVSDCLRGREGGAQ